MSAHMNFIGVSTASSSIMRVFPLWADILGLPTRELVGIDVPLDATAAQYRDVVTALRDDPTSRGALVTTHKMAIYAAAADLFDDLDDFAVSCREISSISRAGDRLVGHAKDPLTAALALNEIIADDHFARTGGEVLILGAGGAGTALSWALAERADAPARVTVTAIDDDALADLAAVHDARGTPAGFLRGVRVASAAESAALVTALPPGSIVVNATGLGKDRPGSPLPDDVVYPDGIVVWEFNYRGSLEFLHAARASTSDIVVADGWRYFIHGWTQVIAEVFGLTLTPNLVEELAAAAESVRG